MCLKRIFIVGCPRSGTTLLQSFFATHQQVVTFPESHFFTKLKSNRRLNRWFGLGLASPSVYKQIQKLLENLNHAELIPPKTEFGYTYKSTTHSFIKCLDTIAELHDANSWAEKTPMHLHHIETIERYVPTSFFVHIIRNGKDVVPSMYEVTHKYAKQWGGVRTLHKCIMRWNNDIELTFNNRNKHNHIIVDYENLIHDSKKVMDYITNLVGLEEWMPNVKPNSEKIVEGIVYDEEQWKSNNFKKVEKRESKFNTILSDYQRTDVNKLINIDTYEYLMDEYTFK